MERWFAISLLFLGVPSVFPQTRPQVLDLNPNDRSSSPSLLRTVGDTLYFFADNVEGASGLFRTAGEGGAVTELLAFFRSFPPGELAGLPDGSAVVAGRDRKSQAFGLWRTSGRVAGTVPLIDPVPMAGIRFNSFTAAGGLVYFMKTGHLGRWSLWRTNGTRELTFPVADGSAFWWSEGRLVAPAAMGERLLFFTPNGELWRSDATGSGTFRLLADRTFSDVTAGAVVQDRYVFASYGTLRSISFAGEEPEVLSLGLAAQSGLVRVGDVLWFGAPSAEGWGLWRTAGTPQTTTRPVTLPSEPAGLTAWRNGACFLASSPEAGQELWCSDGTAAGTRLVRDLTPGFAGSQISQLTALGNLLFFVRDTPETGAELWATDGTANGTRLVRDILPGPGGSNPGELTALGALLYFAADNGINGRELWRSDGTAAGTAMVQNVNPAGEGLWPGSLTNLNGVLLFSGGLPETGQELWRSDGTLEGTRVVKDIHPGPAHAWPGPIVTLGGVALFGASSPDGPGLWKTDGTEAGTVPLSNQFRPGWPQRLGQTILFLGQSSASGKPGLWRSDGTVAGTFQVVELPDAENWSPVVAGNYMFWNGHLGLWRTDGTALGTFRIALNCNQPIPVGDLVYCQNGNELWKSDGTVAGTVKVQDIRLRRLDTGRWLGAFGGLVYVSAEARPDTSESGLWRSDGTPAGTFPLPKADNDGVFFVQDLTNAGGVLYFVGASASSGLQLFRLDPQGRARLVRTINPQGNAFLCCDTPLDHRFTEIDGQLFFQADDGSGFEPWRSDGTAAGTYRVEDIWPGATSSNPWQFTVAGSHLFFAAQDPLKGRELMTIPRHQLTVTGSPGAVTASPETPDRRYVDGTVVQLSVDADGDGCRVFSGWSANAPEGRVVMNQPQTVTAQVRCAGGVDVTSSFQVQAGPAALHPVTGRWTHSVTVANAGAAVSGVDLVTANLPAGAALYQASGATRCMEPVGAPYRTLGAFAAGERRTFQLEFQASPVTAPVWQPVIIANPPGWPARTPVDRTCR